MSGTSTDTSPLTTLQRKKRFHRKVTSGCSTCRIRRVKCDEAKPYCMRCVKTGRTCPGYIVQPTVIRVGKPLQFQQWKPKVIAPTTYHSTEEARDLSFFLKRSAPMISMASGSNDLWTIILPQVSWEYPELREMLYAFSCLDQHFMSSATHLNVEGQFQPGLQHFNKAIRGLTRGTPALHNILLSSLLGWMFEITVCNFANAKVHITAAQRILKECEERDRIAGKSTDHDPIIEAVKAVQFDPHWREIKAIQDTESPPDEIPEMNSIEEAWTTLEDVMKDLKGPNLDSAAVARGRRRMRLWRTAFIDRRNSLSSRATAVPLSAKRPIVLLHTIGSVCLELQSPQMSDSSVGRRKRWECILNDSENILQYGYGYRIENGVRMLLDVIIAQADPELEVCQRACRLRQRLGNS